MADYDERQRAEKNRLYQKAQGLLDDPSSFEGDVEDEDSDLVGAILLITFNTGCWDKLRNLAKAGFVPSAFVVYIFISHHAAEYGYWCHIADVFGYDKTVFVGIYDFDCLPPQFFIEMMHDVGIEAMEVALEKGEFRDTLVQKIINGEKNRRAFTTARVETGKVIPDVKLIPVDDNEH
jgi:hypothetical protein